MWLPDDAAKALAYLDHQRAELAERCDRCGTRSDDWVDEHGRRWTEPAWIAETVSCPGCDAIDAALSMVPDERRAHTSVRLRPATAADFVDVDDT